MERNILIQIAYDGSCFHGWQRQPDKVTVCGYLEDTMRKLFGRDIALSGTSRTDAGVHALMQMASFRTDISIPADRIAMVVNNALAGREKGAYALSPVKIVRAWEMDDDFHARFDSKGKKYIYRIDNSGDIDVFRRNYVYHVRTPLDTDVMRREAAKVCGTHDFRCFQSAGGNPRLTTVRTVRSLDIMERGRDIELHITGDGFLYNMVRIITGTLVDMGSGRMDKDMDEIIDSLDRREAGHTAPPYGLYLAEVYYEQEMLR